MGLAWQKLPGRSTGLGTHRTAYDARGGMGGALGVLGVGYAGRSQRRMRRVNRSAARLSRGGIGDLRVECVKEVSGRVFFSIWGAGAPWERPPTDYLKVVHGGSLYRIVVVWKVLCQGVIFDSLVEWDSILLHAVEEWSGSNAAIDGFVRFDLGGCKIAVTAISIRSREKVGSVEGIGGVYSGRAPDLALRSLDSGWLAAHRTKDREISR